jgi:hypothetical protein
LPAFASFVYFCRASGYAFLANRASASASSAAAFAVFAALVDEAADFAPAGLVADLATGSAASAALPHSSAAQNRTVYMEGL